MAAETLICWSGHEQEAPQAEPERFEVVMNLCRDCAFWTNIPADVLTAPPPLVPGERVAMCVLTLRYGRQMVDPESKAVVLCTDKEPVVLCTTESFGCVQFVEHE